MESEKDCTFNSSYAAEKRKVHEIFHRTRQKHNSLMPGIADTAQNSEENQNEKQINKKRPL